MDGIRGATGLTGKEFDALCASFSGDSYSVELGLSRCTEESSTLKLTGEAAFNETSLARLVKNLESFITRPQEPVTFYVNDSIYEFSTFNQEGMFYYLINLKDSKRNSLCLGFNAWMQLFEIEYGTDKMPEITTLKKEVFFRSNNEWIQRLFYIEEKFFPSAPETRVIYPKIKSSIPSLSSLSSACASG
jgi:hypothetical protein